MHSQLARAEQATLYIYLVGCVKGRKTFASRKWQKYSNVMAWLSRNYVNLVICEANSLFTFAHESLTFKNLVTKE
jgi:hypothetical protein